MHKRRQTTDVKQLKTHLNLHYDEKKKMKQNSRHTCLPESLNFYPDAFFGQAVVAIASAKSKELHY